MHIEKSLIAIERRKQVTDTGIQPVHDSLDFLYTGLWIASSLISRARLCSPCLEVLRVAKLSHAAAMAGSKTVLMSFMVLALVVVACLPAANGVRDLGVSDVQELSMVEQEQVVRVQEEDMESAKRHLLSYDPYYNKWYGGKH